MSPLLRRRQRQPDVMTHTDVREALSRYAGEVSDGCIVEIGSYRGGSAAALAEGVQRAGRETPIYAIDPHEPFAGVRGGEFGPEDRAGFYRRMLETGAYTLVRLVNLPG